MTSIVDDDIDAADPVHQCPKESGICRAPLEDRDPWLLQSGFVEDIDRVDVRPGEKGFPHAKGSSADIGCVMAADSDLEKVEGSGFEMGEVRLVVSRVA